jgi:hypothetical protein
MDRQERRNGRERGEKEMMMMMDDGWGRKRRSQGSVE